MANALAPQKTMTLGEGGLALGIRRLSIIDLEGGHQPIANEDATLHVDDKTGGLHVFFGGIRSTKPDEPNDALNTATAPVCAMASTISTPGMIGAPGKCP